jgi:hypothetical protein
MANCANSVRCFTPATPDDILLPFSFPSVARKRITVALDVECITFDSGDLDSRLQRNV